MNSPKWFTLSYALDKLIAQRLAVLPLETSWSTICLTVNMACMHPRPFLKPNWLSAEEKHTWVYPAAILENFRQNWAYSNTTKIVAPPRFHTAESRRTGITWLSDNCYSCQTLTGILVYIIEDLSTFAESDADGSFWRGVIDAVNYFHTTALSSINQSILFLFFFMFAAWTEEQINLTL